MSYVDNEILLRTMRAMAWDRAKGELQSVLSTFWGGRGGRDDQFRELDEAISQFVKIVEDNGLHE